MKLWIIETPTPHDSYKEDAFKTSHEFLERYGDNHKTGLVIGTVLRTF